MKNGGAEGGRGGRQTKNTHKISSIPKEQSESRAEQRMEVTQLDAHPPANLSINQLATYAPNSPPTHLINKFIHVDCFQEIAR